MLRALYPEPYLSWPGYLLALNVVGSLDVPFPQLPWVDIGLFFSWPRFLLLDVSMLYSPRCFSDSYLAAQMAVVWATPFVCCVLLGAAAATTVSSFCLSLTHSEPEDSVRAAVDRAKKKRWR